MRIRSFFFCFVATVLLCLTPGPVPAQESEGLTDREREMLELIRRLEQRVDDLEERLEKYESAPELPGADEPSDVEPAPAAAQAPVEAEPTPQEPETSADATGPRVIASGEEGFRIRSADDRFGLRIGGRLQLDWGVGGADDDLDAAFGEPSDGARFRRVWLSASGDLYEDYFYRIQLDFVGGDVGFRDVYMGRENIPGIGTLTVGQFKEPFGLEQSATSNANLLFLERAFTSEFVALRNIGIMANNAVLDDRLTWAVAYLRDEGNAGIATSVDNGNNLTMRLTGLPWYEDEGRKLVHLGAAYSFRNPAADTRFRAQPESRIGGISYVDTGMLDVDRLHALGAEAALVYKRYSLQSEFTHVRTDDGLIPNSAFNAFYVAGSVVLTGEHRRYSRSSGGFGTVVPRRSVGSRNGERGWGAWEVTGRYSGIDLNDGLVRGGRQRNLTLGLSWYLNANFRVLWNYVYADIENDLADGDAHLFLTRLQLKF